MYAAEKTEHLWIVRRPTDTPGDPFCVTDYGEKGEADARMIADALNEVAQLRAENERLKSVIAVAFGDGKGFPSDAALGKGAA